MSEEKTKKITPKEMFAAISTIGANASEFLNSKRLQAKDEESDVPYWNECQLNSGVKFKLKDDKLIIIYTEESMNPLRLDWRHNVNIDNAFADILSYLKKEYKNITGKALSLKQESDILENALYLSNRRVVKNYISVYSIGGVDSVAEQDKKDVKEILKSAFKKADEMTVFKKKK